MIWRPMSAEDLPAVADIADRVHVNYPEDAAVFAERLALYPAGCFMLRTKDRAAAGYALTHPWIMGRPPALNTLLHAIPAAADTYYIHDVALLDTARGGGMATALVRDLAAHATTAGLATMSLVAANNSVPFWSRHGFRVETSDALREKLLSYDAQAAFMVRDLTS